MYRPGHALAETELIFPVGRRMAIVGAYELNEGIIELDENGVASVNAAMVAFAGRQVYAAEPDFVYARRPNEMPRRGASLINDIQFVTKRSR